MKGLTDLMMGRDKLSNNKIYLVSMKQRMKVQLSQS